CSLLSSSRRRHTRFSRDWSSDVCSSDLFDGIPWYMLMVCNKTPFEVKGVNGNPRSHHVDVGLANVQHPNIKIQFTSRLLITKPDLAFLDINGTGCQTEGRIGLGLFTVHAGCIRSAPLAQCHVSSQAIDINAGWGDQAPGQAEVARAGLQTLDYHVDENSGIMIVVPRIYLFQCHTANGEVPWF